MVGLKLFQSLLVAGKSCTQSRRALGSIYTHVRTMSAGKILDISGIFPPIATPFDENEDIDWHQLDHNMNKWNKVPFKGYVVQGSNGEYAYLDPEERVEMVRRVKEMASAGKLILAGSGCESTRETIKMTEKMAGAGADAALVVTPCYYKASMTNAAMESHFTKVADASPIPVILYSVPPNTTIDLAPEVIIKLSQHPNIIGLKDSGGDISKLGNLVYKTEEQNFQILAGSASFLYPALVVGCVGGVCALANVLGNETYQLYDLYQKGDVENCKALQHRLISPNAGVTRGFGVPGLKVAMEWYGFYGGPLRSPLQPLTQEQIKALRETFVSTGFLDAQA